MRFTKTETEVCDVRVHVLHLHNERGRERPREMDTDGLRDVVHLIIIIILLYN